MNDLIKMDVVLVFKKRPANIEILWNGNAGRFEPNCPMAVRIAQKEIRFILGRSVAMGLHDLAIQTIGTSGFIASHEHLTIHSTTQEISVTPVTFVTFKPARILKVEQRKFHRRWPIIRQQPDKLHEKLKTVSVWIGIQSKEIQMGLEVVSEIWHAYREFRNSE